jgi:hypothetical protein
MLEKQGITSLLVPLPLEIWPFPGLICKTNGATPQLIVAFCLLLSGCTPRVRRHWRTRLGFIQMTIGGSAS